ncbi:MAG: hypothetical protein RSB01_05440 [Brevundimonas sp.]
MGLALVEKFSITKFVPTVLKERPGQRFIAREIAMLIMQQYPDACEDKRLRSKASKTPLDNDDALLQQIVAEIGAQRKRLENRLDIKTTEERPRKYYYSTQSDTAEIEAVEKVSPLAGYDNQPTKLLEADLYPILSEFLFNELNIYSKRIDEKRSRKQYGPDGNKWLYPDLVGIEDLTSNWERAVIECVSASSETRTKLYSFEVKLLLNRSNVRECFFQTVSNSSWANFPYLVAAEVQGSETLSELRVLSGTHGVGLIRLDPENPSESEILIPAKERTAIDWNSANRLAASSTDFTDYLNLVRQFYQTKDIRPQDWDYSGI